MNETPRLDNLSNVPWSSSDALVRPPEPPNWQASEKAPVAAVGMLKQAVQGAHASLDRLADRAGPAVRQLGESVSAAEVALQEKTDLLRQKRDAWVEGARTQVRAKPMVAVAAAVALGVVIARLTRRTRRTQ